MRLSRALLGSVLVLAATVTSCSAISHLHILQPMSLPPGHRPAAPARSFARAPGVQLGIDLDFYAWPGMDVSAVARTDIAYIKRLHANAVSISFPFFMHNGHSTSVYAGPSTPAPGQLMTFATAAENAGLYVSFRPLLDERALGGPSRNHWTPTNLPLWFASYQRFLIPYAEVAEAAHVPEFVTGVEFSMFQKAPEWAHLDAALRRDYGGTLSYSNNFGGNSGVHRTVNARGVVQTLDAYKPLQLRPRAHLSQVKAAWDRYGRTLPRGTVLAEVGIAAQPGAYRAPYEGHFAGKPLRPSIQKRWFASACDAVAADHLGGIYFWAVSVGQSLTIPPTARHPASFVDGPGAGVIATCFERLGSGPAA